MDIAKIVATWPKDEKGYAISPGVAWLASGAIGAKIKIGDGFKAGDGFTAGNWFTAGDGFIAGDGFTAGDGFIAGDDASDSIPLGCTYGYWKQISQVYGVAYIGSGCHWFTLADALKYWAGKKDRELTMCIMEAAKAIADLKGWKYE